jgi:DNA-binding IclR family transcriptional regulator
MKPLPTRILKIVAALGRIGYAITFGAFIRKAGLGLNDGQNLWRRLLKHGYIRRAGRGTYAPMDKLAAELKVRDGDE